jgi:hypothetical protein
MNSWNMKHIMLSLMLLVFLFLTMFSDRCLALAPVTHSAINERIAKVPIFDDYLKKQLGLQGGVETSINQKKIWELFREGGAEEDAGARSLNHFHNPLTNAGLSTNYSALTWATMPVGTQNFAPISSWYDVRNYYFKALTSADKTTRDDYFAQTFQGVGQVMHLVQDMSVPAHTRGDKHPSLFGIGGDPYEKWFLKSTAPVISSYSSYNNYTPYTSSFIIPQLFDSDQYGNNPSITTSANIGLSEYTNANFLSQGTIFTTNFSYPAYADMSPKVETNPTTKKQILYLSKKGHGESVDYFARALSLHNYLPADYKKLALTLDDEKVHANYAHFLIPRAIGYSAQVLSYFFRGKLDVEMSNGSLKIRNASQETMTGGKFDLYYDKATGERNLLTSADVSALAFGADQTITFSSPQDVSAYMLVYKNGTLGNETNAVIGKLIPVSELVVITVNINSTSVSFVWNPMNNSLERAPVDNNDTDFQKWYQARTAVQNQNMFGGRTYCGNSETQSIGNFPSSCQQLIPGAVDTRSENTQTTELPWDYGIGWDNTTTWSCDIKATSGRTVNGYGMVLYIMPESFYAPVNIPGSQTVWSGIRTRTIGEGYTRRWARDHDPNLFGTFQVDRMRA